MKQEHVMYAQIAGIALIVLVYILVASRRRDRPGIAGVVMPVMIVNPDGSPVNFGQEPLILTDRKKE